LKASFKDYIRGVSAKGGMGILPAAFEHSLEFRRWEQLTITFEQKGTVNEKPFRKSKVPRRERQTSCVVPVGLPGIGQRRAPLVH
jgi:hypothetical protein